MLFPLLLKGRDKNQLNRDLEKVVLTGNGIATQLLIDAKADVNKPGNNGQTSLMGAVGFRGSLVSTRRLIANKADVNARDKDRDTPLLWAIKVGNCDIKIVKALVKAKADVNAQNKNRYTPLLLAIEDRVCDIEIVKVLVNAKADVNEQNCHGYTPLINAVRFGFENAAVVLLEAKADASRQDFDGNKAINHIGYSRHFNVERLLEHGFDLEQLSRGAQELKSQNKLADLGGDGSQARGSLENNEGRGSVAGSLNQRQRSSARVVHVKNTRLCGAAAVDDGSGESEGPWTRFGRCVVLLTAAGVGILAKIALSSDSMDSPVGGSSSVRTNSLVDSDAVVGVAALGEALVSVPVEVAEVEDVAITALNKEASVSDLDNVLGQAQDTLVEVGNDLYPSKNSEVAEKVFVQEKQSTVGFMSDETLNTVKKTALASVFTVGVLKLFHYCYLQYKKNSGLHKARIWAKKAFYYAQQHKKMTIAASGSLAVVGFYFLQNR